MYELRGVDKSTMDEDIVASFLAWLPICNKMARHFLLSYLYILGVMKNKASLGHQEPIFWSLFLSVIEWVGDNVCRPLREISSPVSRHQATCDGDVSL